MFVFQLCACAMQKPTSISDMCQQRIAFVGIEEAHILDDDVETGIVAGVLGAVFPDPVTFIGGSLVLYGGVLLYYYDTNPTYLETQLMLNQSEESERLRRIDQTLVKSGLVSYVDFQSLDLKHEYDRALPQEKLNRFMQRNHLRLVIGVSSNIRDASNKDDVIWKVYDGDTQHEYEPIITKSPEKDMLFEQALLSYHVQQFSRQWMALCDEYQ